MAETDLQAAVAGADIVTFDIGGSDFLIAAGLHAHASGQFPRND